jgi:16S rRNA processing protein RimM
VNYFLNIGKIVNTHGVKGCVKVLPLTCDINRYNLLESVYVGDKRDVYYIENIRYAKGMVILKMKYVDNMDQAAALKGLCISVDREHAVKLSDDEFFVCDLIGCSVYNEYDKLLGILVDVISTGSNDVYVVRNDLKKELLIPALKSVVKSVLISEKKVTVKLPEGLVEDEV